MSSNKVLVLDISKKLFFVHLRQLHLPMAANPQYYQSSVPSLWQKNIGQDEYLSLKLQILNFFPLILYHQSGCFHFG